MVTGGSPMGLCTIGSPLCTYLIETLKFFLFVIEYELAGTKATAGICQLSFAFHLNHLNRCILSRILIGLWLGVG